MATSDDIAQELLNRQADPMQALSKADRITADPQRQAIADAELMRGEMPMDPGFIKTLGKPVGELLGMVFHTKAGSGLPHQLRISNWDAGTGNVLFHSIRKDAEPFSASPSEIDQMLEKGWITLAQPAKDAVAHIGSMIRTQLGAFTK